MDVLKRFKKIPCVFKPSIELIKYLYLLIYCVTYVSIYVLLITIYDYSGSNRHYSIFIWLKYILFYSIDSCNKIMYVF